MSDEAIRKATGANWDEWASILDRYPEMDHRQRAKQLAQEHPELSGWWVQSIVVGYEQLRGLRVEGQTSTGTFQSSAQRTVEDLDAAWEALMERDWLGAPARWEEGATFPDTDGCSIVVRAVRPARLLRFWRETPDGRRIVTVQLHTYGKPAVRFQEDKLATAEERDASKARWQEALERLVA